jgi:pimeloyl-ACP methyl ester carboxylesterase
VTKEGTIRTPDGRQLAYIERGVEDGKPVFLHHGTPGSRFTRYPDPRAYEEHGLRVITYDRPGYGKSDRDHGRNVGSAPADVQALADHLGIDRFVTLGVSGGAPHSIACASLLPDRVPRAGAIVTPAPYDAPGLDFLAGMTDLNVKEFSAALEGEETLWKMLEPVVKAAQEDPEDLVTSIEEELPEVDRKVLQRPEVREILQESMAEAVRQDAQGWIDDDIAFTQPWGFDLGQVENEIGIWQGELDVLAPRSHGEWVAQALPNATFTLVPGAGHMLYDEWIDAIEWLHRP